jgi:ataxia telangiectasia mutated family protein
MSKYIRFIESRTSSFWSSSFERMLTRILNLGNIMVVSSAVRRGPYWHILETSLHANGGVYNRHIVCVLREVSERMGLAPSTMFEVYASQIAYSIRQAGHDFLRFPPHVLGYANRRECAENTFRAFTPTNVLAGGPNPKAVAHGQKLFANHCRAIQKSVSDGLRECFGDVIGIQIVSWMDEHRHDPKAGILDSLDDVLQSKTKSIVDFGDFDDVLSRNIDGVVAAILRTLNDHDYSKDGPIVRALQSTDSSGGAARVFQQLSQYRHKDKICTHEPNLPAFPTITVLPALDWFSRWKPDLQTAHATTYHVIHELLADIQRSPLVNEQIRLLNAICVWVAFRRDEFKNPTLLHTLIQGASSLLAQSDLARTAQSILEWCFACYRKNASKDPRFPDVLIRISCSAHDYARTDDTEITQLGTELLHWVNDQFLQLCRVPLLRGQVVKALPALPHQPSPELSHVYEDIKSETLSALLGDHRIMSNKFRLVRRLTDRAIQNQYGGRQFSACDFWRLKACIPPAEQLQDSDIDTFASLLVLNKGQIQSVGTEQNLAQSVRDRHRRGLRKRTPGPTTQDSSPQQSIVLSLLAMLDGTSPAQVHVAYRTLRLLMSTSDLRFGQLASWPPEHHQELEFLQTYPRTPSKRPDRDLNELLTSEDFLRLTNFPEWISKVTVLISDTLASYDMFYAHLTPILQSDIDYAEDMLPVLIHILLHTGIAKRVASQVSVRTIISQYLTTVLASNKVNVACLRSVVDTVLHLRNFQPDGTSDALAHDKWLDINFTLLAKNAVICGAYTTALLFLELASEHQDTFAHKDPAVEQILFDIYSHIDEPDGFYGIQTSDLRQFLIERFHHEKQWEKALRFHGAAFEAGRTDSSAAEGLLQSFHAFGFDHLAIGTLQSGSLGNPTARSAASNMSYRLGWRTETWDLPDQNVTSGNSLYFALRAIHRERDPTRASIVVRHALSSEMERLRNVGPENLAEIRQVIQNLMCLNQITHWRRDLIQRRIASKHIDLNEWGDFVDMSSDFEYVIRSLKAHRR